MRCRFNRARYWERLRAGEFSAVIKRSAHPAPPSSGQPHCTHSQSVYYIDLASGAEVARVHQYLRPDNTIGGSGKPDPKRLVQNGIMYRLVSGSKPAKRMPRWVARAWDSLRCAMLGIREPV